MDDPYNPAERALAIAAYVVVPLLALCLYALIAKALL